MIERASRGDARDRLWFFIGTKAERIATVLRRQWRVIQQEDRARYGIAILAAYLAGGVFAPWIAPYDPGTRHRSSDGSLRRLEGPSMDHFFGTTQHGYDVFSQVIWSTRASIIVGFTAAFVAVLIGSNIGLISAYYGGRVEDFLMRLTDITYGVPFIPFIIVLVVVLGGSLFNIIFAISLIMWRSSARVVRSQVLSIKNRPYIKAAKASGASDVRVIYFHILPNVAPLIFIYAAFGVAWAILAEAGLAFLGFADPEMYSWGQMIFEVYNADLVRVAWWWVLPPGAAISLLVISVFLISMAYETVTNPTIQ